MNKRIIDPREGPRNKKSNKLGLIDEEQKVMDKLMECYSSYLDLEYQHPDDLTEFGYAVHLIQGLLAMRVARRAYPNGWSDYGNGETYRDLNQKKLKEKSDEEKPNTNTDSR